MRQLVLFTLIVTLSLLVFSLPVKANTKFEMYMNDFYTKQEKASNLLKEIEIDLKNGSTVRVCSRQKQAAKYGIEATKSLIKAFEIDGTTTDMNIFQAGLDKWKELRDYC